MGKHCGRFGHGGSRQFGHGGDDSLIGGAGRDHLRGRDGDDLLEGRGGSDFLLGNRGDDVLSGGDGSDYLKGGHGDDELSGGAGRDWLGGHHGNDWLFGDDGDDRLHGSRGDDVLRGGAGNDKLDGGHGDDLLEGGAGNDQVGGGLGDDVFVYRQGDSNDCFNGGRGDDVIRLDGVAAGWTLDLGNGRVLSDEDGQLQLSHGSRGTITFADGSKLRFSAVERIESVGLAPGGTTPPNQAPGSLELSASTAYENAPEGTVVGVVAAADPDAGDALTYALLDDAGGRFAIDPATGAITVNDGALLDFETADEHSIVVQVTDAGGLSASAPFTIAVQWDNTGNDEVFAGDTDDVIDGGPGDDSLNGEGGNDHLIGGDGNDALDGGVGDDVLEGQAGDDFLTGGDGNDQLRGDAGDDQMFGLDGDDLLEGGDGADQLFGGMGHDVLEGGAGDDRLTGGMGADRFVFDAIGDGVDTIADFEDVDELAIGNMLVGFEAGQESAYVSLFEDAAGTTILVDVDGAGGGANFEAIAVLQGVTGTSLSALVSAGQIDFWVA
jgi:Ca2+-binding RTX toxin-like protein